MYDFTTKDHIGNFIFFYLGRIERKAHFLCFVLFVKSQFKDSSFTYDRFLEVFICRFFVFF